MDDIISRQTVFDALEKVAKLFPYRVPGNYDTYDRYNEAWHDAIGRAEMEIEGLPPVNPQRTGHWIEVAKYSDGKHKIECSECGNHIFDRGHANSYNVRKKYKYCPSCGARMIEPRAEGSDKV